MSMSPTIFFISTALYQPQRCSLVNTAPPFSPPVPQPAPTTPRPEGRPIIPVKGEPLGVVTNWPPALQAALVRWGATQGKSPALTALDITGKPLYTLTYGTKLGPHTNPCTH